VGRVSGCGRLEAVPPRYIHLEVGRKTTENLPEDLITLLSPEAPGRHRRSVFVRVIKRRRGGKCWGGPQKMYLNDGK